MPKRFMSVPPLTALFLLLTAGSREPPSLSNGRLPRPSDYEVRLAKCHFDPESQRDRNVEVAGGIASIRRVNLENGVIRIDTGRIAPEISLECAANWTSNMELIQLLPFREQSLIYESCESAWSKSIPKFDKIYGILSVSDDRRYVITYVTGTVHCVSESQISLVDLRDRKIVSGERFCRIFPWYDFSGLVSSDSILGYCARRNEEFAAEPMLQLLKTGEWVEIPVRAWTAAASPDGKRIAIISEPRDGRAALRIMDAELAYVQYEANLMMPEESTKFEIQPAWSEDGKLLCIFLGSSRPQACRVDIHAPGSKRLLRSLPWREFPAYRPIITLSSSPLDANRVFGIAVDRAE